MSTYIIGDIQGCYRPLQRLLEHIAFNPASDRLLLCGDLVNRGPESLSVLRWAFNGPESITGVLGNHDLHLLARAEALRPPGKLDTMDDVLASQDCHELLDRLSLFPFAHTETFSEFKEKKRKEKFLLVHAGIHPQWSIEKTIMLAEEATSAIRADRRAFLETIYSAPPPRLWSESFTETERLRFTVSILTRIRTLHDTGEMDDDYTGPLNKAPPGRIAWFDARNQYNPENHVIFGHWAALGLLKRKDVTGLDTGCVWGGYLSAYRLEDGAVFQVSADGKKRMYNA